MKKLSFLFILPFLNIFLFAQSHKILQSTSESVKIEYNFENNFRIKENFINGERFYNIENIEGEKLYTRRAGEPFLPDYNFNIGVPFNSNPIVKILSVTQDKMQNVFILPTPDSLNQPLSQLPYDKDIYNTNNYFPKSPSIITDFIMRYARIANLSISPYQFNPVSRELIFNKKIVIQVDFKTDPNNYSAITKINDVMTEDFIRTSVINNKEAKEFIGKSISNLNTPVIADTYWYNPQKDYYKIFVRDKNVYRITYEELISIGAQLGSNTPLEKLELFNSGLPVPIDVTDNNLDSFFNNGDYFQFVGYPPDTTPYCTMNIYNLSNVYWFSYESDSTGLFYINTPGTPNNFNRNYLSSLQTIHFEKDSLYERLGYAPNENIDYWFWGKASANGGQANQIFQFKFNEFPDYNFDSNRVQLKIGLQGMTNSPYCNTEHKAYISVTEQPIGDIVWDGQKDIIFDKLFYVSSDSIKIYPTGNTLKVEVRGDNCQLINNDEIRINWFEFDYWRLNRVHDKYYNFTNYDPSGRNRYVLWQWLGSDMRIYIPQKNKLIYYPTTSDYITFMDTVYGKTEYFCSSSDHYFNVDSIVVDIPSDLRDLTNGVDYLIITHQNFGGTAQQLANLRANNFPDESIPNPRIQIVEIQQIYDEFSFGLLNPFALKDFVKYVFENWQTPAISYIVLIGDMSYDYRGLLQTSRPNFIPSIPYFARQYGQSASDNLIVSIGENDVTPDIAIGRLSIETVEEGNIILQKLSNYPIDNTKSWKQNVLLLASGLSLEDELDFGFNDASVVLCSTYVEPNGFSCTKVFRYPSRPEHMQYQGEGPKIREEINKGAAIVNYYGHGGGFQWDLTFLNDDIYLLENGGRLPLILSVTCYTAHFDNQDVFGEQFNKVEGKGSIGFYGSAGLTYWDVGKALNLKFFNEIFNQKNYIVGKAILNSKNQVPTGGTYSTQIALLTYLGDPVLKLALPQYPDFEVKASDISITPENPLVGDTISVKINIRNLGIVFQNDSVTIELFAESTDSSYLIDSTKLGSFPEVESVFFKWVPNAGGLFNLIVKVNENNAIIEEDHSDNIAEGLFVIFNLSDPNIIGPIDGFATGNNQVEFTFSDIGYYIDKQLKYNVEIDTSSDFVSPIISSGDLSTTGALVQWKTPDLFSGVYFWRSRIFDGIQYGRWSSIRSFSIMDESKDGYYAHGKILKLFDTYNINYSESSQSLKLNSDPLPAKPSEKTLLQHFFPQQLPDSIKLTSLATDGTYLYTGNIWATATQNNGYSMIYKFGTGNNGTVAGQFYGTLSAFHDSIKNTIAYHSDGYLYVAVGMSHKLVRINVTTEEIDTVDVPPGLLRWDRTTTDDGPVYLNSDGKYIYNLTLKDTLGNQKYTLRILDPSNNWSLVKPDQVLTGSSFPQGITGFFVHGEYIYPVEYFNANYMRRIRLSDGLFEEEWVVMSPFPSNFQSYYSWCWDWQNDNIYASVYRTSGFIPKFSRFAGDYIDANGFITSKPVGPVASWTSLVYDVKNTSPTGQFNVNLLGLNSTTKNWDTLQINIPDSISLSTVNPDIYSNLEVNFNFTDSGFVSSEPIELKSIHFNYIPLSDVYFEKKDFIFQQDSVLQGIPITFNFQARRAGYFKVDSLDVKFYLNDIDSLVLDSMLVFLTDDASNSLEHSILTDKLLFENDLRVVGELDQKEYFYYNNLIEKNFYVVRDSLKPTFKITFDGKEILDGDFVSAKPEVKISLKDNSPLPLDESLFTIVYDYNPIDFIPDTLEFDYIPYPNSEAIVKWTPTITEDGIHSLEVLAKDASGNFFDTTSYRISFNVFNESDLKEVYNYPNPFKNDTYFTFILTGAELPEELKINIYTIAGRLIKTIKVPSSALGTDLGFKRIHWDGRDQDGDEIGNGLYFYKMIYKNGDVIKTVTQKLAKVR